MKFLIFFCIAAVLICQVIAAPTEEIIQTPTIIQTQPIFAPEDIIREQRSYGAPPAAYSAPPASYAPAPISPPKTYSYPSPAPTIPCGQALILSCAPSVAQAPCAASGGYGGY